jgi:homoserine kinase
LTGAPHALFDATEDRLHQSYRAPALVDSTQLVARLRACGHAAVISGAGPAVLTLPADEAEVAQVEMFTPAGWSGLRLPVDLVGAARV